MIINVTQEDIDNGIPGDTDKCPIALALLRHSNINWAVVSPVFLAFTIQHKKKFLFFKRPEEKTYTYNLPKSIGKWIRNFDIGGKTDPHVKPFSFELAI